MIYVITFILFISIVKKYLKYFVYYRDGNYYFYSKEKVFNKTFGIEVVEPKPIQITFRAPYEVDFPVIQLLES